jgi:hypothetical protein
MKPLIWMGLILLSACASKKDIKSMEKNDVLIIGRVLNLHEGQPTKASVMYRTSNQNSWLSAPRTVAQENYYFTAILNGDSDKFVVKEIRMQNNGAEWSWGKTIKSALAETLIRPDADAIYVGDIIIRTRNKDQFEEVTDFKIIDRFPEAKEFAQESLGFQKHIRKSILRIIVH